MHALAVCFLHNPRMLFKIRAVPSLQGPSSVSMVPLKLFLKNLLFIWMGIHWCVLGLILKPWWEAKQLGWFCYVKILSDCIVDSPHITLQPRQQTLVSTLAIRPNLLVEQVLSVSLKYPPYLKAWSHCLGVWWCMPTRWQGLIEFFFPNTTIPKKLNILIPQLLKLVPIVTKGSIKCLFSNLWSIWQH